jgi:hypothetical protein
MNHVNFQGEQLILKKIRSQSLRKDIVSTENDTYKASSNDFLIRKKG